MLSEFKFYAYNGLKAHNKVSTPYGADMRRTCDCVTCVVDLAAGTIRFKLNGTDQRGAVHTPGEWGRNIYARTTTGIGTTRWILWGSTT